MVTAGAFLILEAVLTGIVKKEAAIVAKAVLAKVSEAISSGDYATARTEISRLNMGPMFSENEDSIEYLTKLAMLFGASRVTQQPGTSVVGLGFESLAIKQICQGFLTGLRINAQAYLIKVGTDYIAKAEANPAQVVEKAERILQPFQSFMDSAGDAYFNIASSLHTSRVSSYGFTAEAAVLGLEEYQINEQLDGRTCPVCRMMHGKVFKVSDARRLLSIVTRTTDPDELTALQPWPKQSKDSLEELAAMKPEDLVAKGWHIPPFHPGCRGLLARRGKAPSLAEIQSGTVKETYTATQADFKAIGYNVTPENVKLWNKQVRLAPAEVVARITGRPIDELLVSLLDAESPKAVSGVTSLKFGDSITMALNTPIFGSKKGVPQTISFNAETGLNLESMLLDMADAKPSLFKKYMREAYALAKDSGLAAVTTKAGLDYGGLAWAKYGFQPSPKQWEVLKKELYGLADTAGYFTSLPKAKSDLIKVLLEATNPSIIFTLADLDVGSELLIGSSWTGSLNLADPESVTRFLTYLGEL